MSQRFSELQIGDRFHYNIDADGHEPYLYKVSDTQAYIEHGRHSGSRRDIAGDQTVHVWDKPLALHTGPTEVERAALSLLMGSRGDSPPTDHVGLHTWIRALATDLTEMRDLDTFIWESEVNVGSAGSPEMIPLRELCAERKQICCTSRYDSDNSAFHAILDEMATGGRAETQDERYYAGVSRAMAILADALCDYRKAGRPAGDQSHTIQGMGLSLLMVTTSLAAQIAKYHYTIINLLHTRRAQ